VLYSLLQSGYEVSQKEQKMKQNKLKLTNTEDRGFKPSEWVELVGMVLALIIFAAVALALFTAVLKLMTEIAG
jgi:flagellar biosynthesis protein FlhB